jgi:hypothetical protein
MIGVSTDFPYRRDIYISMSYITNPAGLYSVFSSQESLQTYAVSEAHQKVVKENVLPNVEGE